MTGKNARPPVNQRRFAGIWAELDYLCKKISFWLYTKRRRSRAEHYLDRLNVILEKLPDNDVAILRWEAHALSCELRHEYGEASKHRKREIQLIERLHREAQRPGIDARTKNYMLQGRDRVALEQRRSHLQELLKLHAGQSQRLLQSSA